MPKRTSKKCKNIEFDSVDDNKANSQLAPSLAFGILSHLHLMDNKYLIHVENLAMPNNEPSPISHFGGSSVR